MIRKRWTDKINEAVESISLYQRGIKTPFRTSIPYLNDVSLGGAYPGDIWVIGGLPGHGKTHLLQQIESSFVPENPGKKIAFLRHYYEMSVQKLLLRNLKTQTGLKITDILLQQPDAERKNMFKKVVDAERAQIAEVIDQALTPSEFERETREFLIANRDKDLCVVSLDHILLVKSDDNKKSAVDTIMEICLRLRMEFPNVLFLIVTQLNREIESRTNAAEAAPRMSDIYQSSTISFGADLIMVAHNPFKLGLKSYLAVDKTRYHYLKEFFTNQDPKAWANLETFGCLYHHFLKVRMPDGDDYDDIFGVRLFEKKDPAIWAPVQQTLNEF